MGWGQLKNGALLQEADSKFDLHLHRPSLKHQRKVLGRKLGILILPTNDWPAVCFRAGEIAARVATLKSGEFAELTWS